MLSKPVVTGTLGMPKEMEVTLVEQRWMQPSAVVEVRSKLAAVSN